MAGAEAREARAYARDEAAQELGDQDARAGVQSPGYVQCEAGMHPDHDDAVVFPPGVLLPRWAAVALEKQRPEPDELDVYRLKLKAGKR